MKNFSKDIESRSLETGKWGNFLMAVAGVVASFLSHSEALLVDGLYSGINFFSAIIAARISISLAKPADRSYPFGYNALEALYVTFRSLVLLGIGIIVFTVFGSVSKIITYATGGSVPELVFGPILIYTVAMVIVCLLLAVWHHRSWKKTGKQSETLKTESKAAVVGAVISGGAGGGLVAAGFLRTTQFGFIVSVADAIIVIILCIFIIRQPISMFLASLGEVAGKSADPKKVDKVKNGLHEFLKNHANFTKDFSFQYSIIADLFFSKLAIKIPKSKICPHNHPTLLSVQY